MNTQGSASDFRIDFPVSSMWFRAIRGLINSAALHCGFDDRSAGQAVMGVDEALCNILQHGYQGDPEGRVTLQLHAFKKPLPRIEIQIDDDVPYRDIGTVPSRSLEEIHPGGLGLHIIHSIMDEVQWCKLDAGGTRLTMTKICKETMITSTPIGDIPS